jgi:hypothetical protein
LTNAPGPTIYTIQPVVTTEQLVKINTTISQPLQVIVKDANDNPVDGMTIEFDAPTTGPSGTFINTNSTTATAITGYDGIASVTFTANSVAGAYLLTAASPDGATGATKIEIANGTFLYDRNAAVAYADKYAHNYNPNYAYPPNDILDDCTNFASQVMFSQDNPNSGHFNVAPLEGTKITSTAWYFHKSNWPFGPEASYTWGAANNMESLFSLRSDRYFDTNRNISKLEGGDIIFFALDSDHQDLPTHTRVVVVGYGNSQEQVHDDGTSPIIGTYGLLIDQHSPPIWDRKRVIWNDGIPTARNFWTWKVIY